MICSIKQVCLAANPADRDRALWQCALDPTGLERDATPRGHWAGMKQPLVGRPARTPSSVICRARIAAGNVRGNPGEACAPGKPPGTRGFWAPGSPLAAIGLALSVFEEQDGPVRSRHWAEQGALCRRSLRSWRRPPWAALESARPASGLPGAHSPGWDAIPHSRSIPPSPRWRCTIRFPFGWISGSRVPDDPGFSTPWLQHHLANSGRASTWRQRVGLHQPVEIAKAKNNFSTNLALIF